MDTNLNVAKIILEQLGGNRFIAMTGAKNFIGDATSLRFRIPMRTRDGSNVVKITLTGMDDYIMEFLSVRGSSVKPKSYREGIYCDALQSTFTSVTGLHTSLGTMRHRPESREN